MSARGTPVNKYVFKYWVLIMCLKKQILSNRNEQDVTQDFRIKEIIKKDTYSSGNVFVFVF